MAFVRELVTREKAAADDAEDADRWTLRGHWSSLPKMMTPRLLRLSRFAAAPRINPPLLLLFPLLLQPPALPSEPLDEQMMPDGRCRVPVTRANESLTGRRGKLE